METQIIRTKSVEKIVDILLEEKFFKDFKKAKLCASDSIRYYNKESAKLNFYSEWLVNNNFAERIK